MGLTVYFRHPLDIGADDLDAAAHALDRHTDMPDDALAEAFRGDRTDPAHLLPCLSVRSGWHLVLSALGLPAGAEVLASGVSIPHMAQIPEAHGLRVRPVDVDPHTLAPSLEAAAAAIGPSTRVLLVAHLYGSRLDLRPWAALARAHDLLLVEDCAQAWAGPGWAGHPEADVSMFSFGMVKTATALGGAVLAVRDPVLARRMRKEHAGWPEQPPSVMAGRLQVARTLLPLAEPETFGRFVADSAARGQDLDQRINGSVRGFPGTDLLWRIAHRPCGPQRALLHRRLARFDPRPLQARARRGEALARRLPPGLSHPGDGAPHRTHWLFPVRGHDPAGLITSLRRAGFDATAATTSITALAPTGRPAEAVPRAAEMLRRSVYVPAWPGLPAAATDRLVDALWAYSGTWAQ